MTITINSTDTMDIVTVIQNSLFSILVGKTINKKSLKRTIKRPDNPVPVKYLPIQLSVEKMEPKATVVDQNIVEKVPIKKVKISCNQNPKSDYGKSQAKITYTIVISPEIEILFLIKYPIINRLVIEIH